MNFYQPINQDFPHFESDFLLMENASHERLVLKLSRSHVFETLCCMLCNSLGVVSVCLINGQKLFSWNRVILLLVGSKLCKPLLLDIYGSTLQGLKFLSNRNCSCCTPNSWQIFLLEGYFDLISSHDQINGNRSVIDLQCNLPLCGLLVVCSVDIPNSSSLATDQRNLDSSSGSNNL